MQKGFSILEVIISLLIISIILFSFAEIELKSFKEVRQTHQYYLSLYGHEKK